MAKTSSKTGFELLFIANAWGFKGKLSDFCSTVKTYGYDGIEPFWPAHENSRYDLADVITKYDLKLGLTCTSTTPLFDGRFKDKLSATILNPYCKPLYINCHNGKDYFDFERGTDFCDYATALSQLSGTSIYHETYRSKTVYSAGATKILSGYTPKIKFNTDISHWNKIDHTFFAANNESEMQDPDHIHIRIGVGKENLQSDPYSAEMLKTINSSIAHWDQIVARKKVKGERLSFLIEIVSPYCMQSLAYNKQPVKERWPVSAELMDYLKRRYLTPMVINTPAYSNCIESANGFSCRLDAIAANAQNNKLF